MPWIQPDPASSQLVWIDDNPFATSAQIVASVGAVPSSAQPPAVPTPDLPAPISAYPIPGTSQGPTAGGMEIVAPPAYGNGAIATGAPGQPAATVNPALTTQPAPAPAGAGGTPGALSQLATQVTQSVSGVSTTVWLVVLGVLGVLVWRKARA